jgi:hypothetical protein
MSRIYVTETDDYGQDRSCGYFSPESATYWHGNKDVFDGANLADVNTRNQNTGQGLYRTAGGRWVLLYWSNWQGAVDQYAYTSPEDAREWLVFNEYDDDVRRIFGAIPEEQGPALRSEALAFARWLQGVEIGLIGEDVNLDALYQQWVADVDPATRDPYAYPAGYDTVTDAHGA